MSEKKTFRWDSNETFIAAAKALSALSEAKAQLGDENRIDFSIDDMNIFQDLLIEQGYAIQKLSPPPTTLN